MFIVLLVDVGYRISTERCWKYSRKVVWVDGGEGTYAVKLSDTGGALLVSHVPRCNYFRSGRPRRSDSAVTPGRTLEMANDEIFDKIPVAGSRHVNRFSYPH